MVARLWGNKIIAGDKKYSDVPAGLKNAVKKYLVSKGYGNLAVEEETETAEPVNNESV